MKRTLAVVLTLCVALSVTTFAYADPVVTAVPTPLGGGLIAWDVFFAGNDGLNASAAVDLKFSGALNEVPTTIAALNVVTLTDQTSFSGLGVDAVADSYVYKGTSTVIPAVGVWNLDLPTGIDNPNGPAGGAANSGANGDPMWISSGTSGGVTINTEQIAHIVVEEGANGGLLTIFGRIARTGTVYDIDQTHAIPEPSTIVMLGIGAFALVGLGWRRKRA